LDEAVAATSQPGHGLERRLGYSESVCAEFFDQIPCGLQVVAAARLAVVPSERALREAIHAVVRRHPVLSSVLDRDRDRDRDGAWRFRPGTGAPVDPRVVQGVAWRDRYQAALTEPLDPDRSLWRVELVVDPSDEDAPAVLVVVGHHAALDGVAAATILGELVRGGDTGPPLPRAEAMETLLPPPTDEGPAPGVAPPGRGWPVEQRAPVAQRRLALTTREVGATPLARIHRRAHEEHTTVNAVLMAVLVDVHDEIDPVGEVVGFNVPADVRRRLDPPLPPDQLGAYFARPHVWARRADRTPDIWARARAMETAFAADLEACLTSGPSWQPGQVARLVEGLADPERDRFDLAYLLTNLGVVELGPSVTGLWFTTVQTAGVEAVVVSAATVAGQLHLTVAWPEPLLGPSTGAAVADLLVERLAALSD
jgi:hypothetical protein